MFEKSSVNCRQEDGEDSIKIGGIVSDCQEAEGPVTQDKEIWSNMFKTAVPSASISWLCDTFPEVLPETCHMSRPRVNSARIICASTKVDGVYWRPGSKMILK